MSEKMGVTTMTHPYVKCMDLVLTTLSTLVNEVESNIID